VGQISNTSLLQQQNHLQPHLCFSTIDHILVQVVFFSPPSFHLVFFPYFALSLFLLLISFILSLLILSSSCSSWSSRTIWLLIFKVHSSYNQLRRKYRVFWACLFLFYCKFNVIFFGCECDKGIPQFHLCVPQQFE
jgi:hypothetical protein